MGGALALTAYDWLLQGAYLDTLRDALTVGAIPWMWSQPYYHGTQYFLSNPEVTLTPDIVLLRWLPNGVFVLIHLLVLYAVGFVGSLQLARKQGWNVVAFVFFWLVFNFNGFLTSHLAAGHFTWTGYFVLPFFFLFLSDLVAESATSEGVSRSSSGLALVLGLLFLNGSLHVAVWCLMIMGIALLWQRTLWPGMVTAMAAGILLGAGRLVPAMVWFSRKSQFMSGYQFVSGYQGLSVLLDGLTTLRTHQFTVEDGLHPRLNWWEFDIYIGFVALIAIAASLIRAIRLKTLRIDGPLAVAGACLLVLSLGDVYALISMVVPFADIERVSTRFIVMPFLLILVAAAGGVDAFVRAASMRGRMAALVVLPFMVWELARHSLHWSVARLEPFFEQATRPVLSIVRSSDSAYVLTVSIAWSISLLALVGIAASLAKRPGGISRTSY